MASEVNVNDSEVRFAARMWELTFRPVFWRGKKGFSRAEAFLDCARRAAVHWHEAGRGAMDIPGAFRASERTLAATWGWGRERVRSFLEDLQCEGSVSRLGQCDGWISLAGDLNAAYRDYVSGLARSGRHPLILETDYMPRHERRRGQPTERTKMSAKLRYEVLRRDGFRCALCGATAEDGRLEVDHIRPIARGGATAPENLRTLCHKCNAGKGTRLDSEV